MFSLKPLRNLKAKLRARRRGEVRYEPARQLLGLGAVQHEYLAAAFIAEFERDEVVAGRLHPIDVVDHRRLVFFLCHLRSPLVPGGSFNGAANHVEGGMSDPQVKSIIERILRLHAESDEIAADIREVYGEAKANGYDKTALGAAVRAIRQRDKVGEAAIAERETIVGLYLAAYDGPSRTHVHVPARETTYPERVSRPASTPEPDATPAGAVVADTSGVTAGETAAAGREASPPPADRPAAPFTLSLAKPLRPHCQSPDNCGSYGSRHCGPCLRAVGLTEAA